MNVADAPADFLSRVALPSLGALPLVRPRLPSLFEAQRGAEVTSDEADEMHDDISSLWRPHVPLPEQRADQIVARAQSKPQDVSLPEAKSFVPKRQDSVVQRGTPAAAPPPSLGPALPAVCVADRQERSGELPNRPERPPEAAFRREDTAALATSPKRQQRRTGRNVAPIRPQAVTHLETETIVRIEPARAAAPEAPLASVTRPVAMPTVMPALLPPSRRQDSMTVPVPPPPPAITITIGRIDIRAAAPPPVTPKPGPRASRPQPQSLDDYLKQRTGVS
jgi:hypothetical protein